MMSVLFDTEIALMRGVVAKENVRHQNQMRTDGQTDI